MLRQCAAELKVEGKTIADFLDEIWETYGYHGTLQISIRVPNISMVDGVLNGIRNQQPAILAGHKISQFIDLAKPANGLPGTNGLTLWYGENIRIIIRPSGTEAKLKCYIEVVVHDSNVTQARRDANAVIAAIKADIAQALGL